MRPRFTYKMLLRQVETYNEYLAYANIDTYRFTTARDSGTTRLALLSTVDNDYFKVLQSGAPHECYLSLVPEYNYLYRQHAENSLSEG